MAFFVCRIIGVALLLLLSGCAARGPYTIDLMPAPEIYDDSVYNPFIDISTLENLPYKGVLFATDRTHATSEDWLEKYYKNERSSIMYLGLGSINRKEKHFTLKEAIQVSLLKNRPNQRVQRECKEGRC